MNELLLSAVLIGSMQVTAYQPIVSQTDDSPCITANGKPVHTDGIAISRDLHIRDRGVLNFGDAVYINGIGVKIVNDVMNSRFKNSVDILVWTQKEEADIWKKFGKRRVKMWKIKIVVE